MVQVTITDKISTIQLKVESKKVYNAIKYYHEYKEIKKSGIDFVLTITNRTPPFRISIDECQLINGPGDHIFYQYYRCQREGSVFFIVKDLVIDRIFFLEKIHKESIIVYLNGVENDTESLQWIHRILRNIFNSLFINKGGFFLHSSSFVYKDHGFLVVGDKGSGKTTTLFEFLKHGATFLANDKTGILLLNHQIILKGDSTSFNVNKDSIENNPYLKSLAPFANYNSVKKARIPLCKGKEVLKFSIEHIFLLDYIICPCFVAEYKGCEVSVDRINKKESERLIHNNTLLTCDSSLLDWLGILDNVPDISGGRVDLTDKHKIFFTSDYGLDKVINKIQRYL